MNRRGFLSAFLKGAVVAVAAPQVVTHGRALRKRLVEPVRLDAFWMQPLYETQCYSQSYLDFLTDIHVKQSIEKAMVAYYARMYQTRLPVEA